MMSNLVFVGTNAAHFILQAVEPNPGSMTREQFNQQIALEAVRHNPGNGPVAILVPIAICAMIVAIVWLGMRQKQARLQTRAEFHKQLLDKFGSGREFTEFLGSPGSQRFLEELWSQRGASNERPLRIGVVLTTLGLALGGLSWTHRGLLVPGVIVLAVGVGYLISSGVSYQLSKKRDQTKELGPGNAPAS
jgi:hypothetical protein